MALSTSEHAKIAAQIITFLQDEFAPVITKYYARGVSYAGKHPQNINNELRNAVTHMARALVCDTIAEADGQMAQATSHVERFKRDCLKVAVIYAGASVSDMMRHAEVSYKRVDPNLSLETFSLTVQRYKVLMNEALGDATAAAQWEALLLDIEKLKDKVMQSYKLLDSKRYWFPVLLLRMWRWLKSGMGVIGLAILASALFCAIVPKQEEFGSSVQAVVTKTVAALFPDATEAMDADKKGPTQ